MYSGGKRCVPLFFVGILPWFPVDLWRCLGVSNCGREVWTRAHTRVCVRAAIAHTEQQIKRILLDTNKRIVCGGQAHSHGARPFVLGGEYDAVSVAVAICHDSNGQGRKKCFPLPSTRLRWQTWNPGCCHCRWWTKCVATSCLLADGPPDASHRDIRERRGRPHDCSVV